MADETRKPDAKAEDEILAKLEKLESDILEIDRARKQQALISRFGLLLILLAFLLFAWNLYRFYQRMTSEENITKLSEQVQSDLRKMFENDDNLKKLQDDLMKNIIPDVTKQVTERLEKEIPVFKKKGEMLLGNIKTHVEESVKMKLAEELDKSVKEFEAELLKQYPNISPEKLEDVFKKSEEVFLEEFTAMIERKVDLVVDDLNEMDKTLNKFVVLAEKQNYQDKDRDMVKLDFLENMLELGIYHVNPMKGELPALAEDVKAAQEIYVRPPELPKKKPRGSDTKKGGAK